ncbi:oligoribonuclease [Pseudidiomarina donghaiensis]|uniref:Oligoribonuclease n=1 Tax=Pseudidiomarina donghaiensis TaxID=519452 RepID=A0A432XIQ1_9GAMM|nr:oligoribonuclease [Pseudidiomarina donghaiensis]RUO48581.1 oligoribonuclease [Pseudidiomarina donghaiensis]SFV24001.1 oligoribonuclease [Pseudidiomarina donghaiensis]
MSASAERLIWIDLEMTGLSPEYDHIIEIATIVTDYDLNVLAEGPVIAVHQPQANLDKMDDWNVRTHTTSGLVARVQESRYDEQQASDETIAFLEQWVTAGSSPMCGNSICQDRRFLAQHMPQLEAYFHYRNLDVSTLKQLAKYWAPEVANGLTKQGAHTALADIRESIEELKYYRTHLFKSGY